MSTTVVAAEFRARLNKVIRSFESVVTLANQVGVSDNAIYKWLSGRGQPSVANLVALARISKVSVEWLATGNVSRSSAGPRMRATDRGDFVFMRREQVRISNARDGVIRSDQVVDWVAFRERWLRRQFNTETGDLILIEVVGDSMAPTVKDSDLILADLAEPRFRRDGIYLLRQGVGLDQEGPGGRGRTHDSHRHHTSGWEEPEDQDGTRPQDGLSVKRLQRRPDGKLSVRCDNPAYEAMTFAPTALKILGRVIWIGSRL